jgi:NAD(P)-dependent dehydrogenase (short-subunit alcohol dehydrogenase family)
MPTILITGANRGLGLEFARQYAEDGWTVIATARNPADAADLAAIKGDVTIHRYNAMEDSSADALAADLAGRPIDVVLMNAASATAKAKPLDALTIDDWNDALLTNTFAPLYLAARLRPNLEAGEMKTLVAISDSAASTSTYSMPDEIAYRASKAALNQMWRNLTVEWREWGCKCLLLCPVDAASVLTASEKANGEAVNGMRGLIETASPDKSGTFSDYRGNTVPW